MSLFLVCACCVLGIFGERKCYFHRAIASCSSERSVPSSFAASSSGCHAGCRVPMYSETPLNLVQTWLTGFPAMDHCTTLGMASSSVRTLMTRVSVNPSALRHAHQQRVHKGGGKAFDLAGNGLRKQASQLLEQADCSITFPGSQDHKAQQADQYPAHERQHRQELDIHWYTE